MGAGGKMMKKKTARLQKLERERFSILTNDLKHCFLCGVSPVDLHEIYGAGNRQTSMRLGFVIPLCRRHHQAIHENAQLSMDLKIVCQQKFEETHTRDDFMKEIHKNYI